MFEHIITKDEPPKRFTYHFFHRDTLSVARELLGARLVRVVHGVQLVGKIVECEAYIGQNDTACHAHRGRTERNSVMFGPPGRAYVYFVYGMHYMLNVVTEPVEVPAAVLIRAVEPIEGIEVMQTLRKKTQPLHHLTNGPAKLTQAFAIDTTWNGSDLVDGHDIWLEPGEVVPDDAIHCGPRIGIHYADEQDILAPWRFWIRENHYVSQMVLRQKNTEHRKEPKQYAKNKNRCHDWTCKWQCKNN